MPFAEGTDGGGSIRIPAAWCGVYGYKASFGRVPMVFRPGRLRGHIPFIFEGPLTRTVEDAALVLNALSGYDGRDPYSLDEDVDFLPATRRGIRGLRVAYSPDLDVFPVDPTRGRRRARRGRRVQGGRRPRRGGEGRHHARPARAVRPVVPADHPALIAAFKRMKAGGFDILGEHREDFPPEFLYWVDKCTGMSCSSA